MARQPIWHDEYWLMLIQIYMKKPVGVKPIYSRELVQLGMELHIHPQYLHRMMTKLDEVESPSVKALMDSYAHNPKKFRKRVETLRLMKGFGNEQSFYDGVEVRGQLPSYYGLRTHHTNDVGDDSRPLFPTNSAYYG